MTVLEHHYSEEVRRLQKTVDLQKNIINNQDQVIRSKDTIINILREQKEILIKSLSDVVKHEIKTVIGVRDEQEFPPTM